MVVFHSYISLPEGNDSIPNMFVGKFPQESVRLEVTLQSAETSAIKVSAQSGAQKRANLDRNRPYLWFMAVITIVI